MFTLTCAGGLFGIPSRSAVDDCTISPSVKFAIFLFLLLFLSLSLLNPVASFRIRPCRAHVLRKVRYALDDLQREDVVDEPRHLPHRGAADEHLPPVAHDVRSVEPYSHAAEHLHHADRLRLVVQEMPGDEHRRRHDEEKRAVPEEHERLAPLPAFSVDHPCDEAEYVVHDEYDGHGVHEVPYREEEAHDAADDASGDVLELSYVIHVSILPVLEFLFRLHLRRERPVGEIFAVLYRPADGFEVFHDGGEAGADVYLLCLDAHAVVCELSLRGAGHAGCGEVHDAVLEVDDLDGLRVGVVGLVAYHVAEAAEVGHHRLLCP